MNEDEEFFAWLDGELHGDAAERVAARVAASPELTARAEQHRKLAAGLRDAFDPVMTAGIAPPSFKAAEVIEFDAIAARRERRRNWFSAPQWAAIAASLLVGIFAGQFLGRDDQGSPVAMENGQLVAESTLRQSLESQLASTPAADGARIGLTFRDRDGRICRNFTDAAISGLACRDGGDWQLRGIIPTAEGQSGDYRMAAGNDPRLASLVGETIVGEPFDAAQEKSARDAGWR